MSFTYGFFNSKNHDRVYDATQLSAIFDGIINDGVYMSIGDRFQVRASTGMTVTVGTGRAWFDHTWNLNDSLLPLVLTSSDLVVSRIDAIVLETNPNTAVRANSIKVIQGLPAENPVKPTMIHEDGVNQYPLAYITIPAGATEILQSYIENAVGLSATPFVTGIIDTVDVEDLIVQWEAEWDEYISVFEQTAGTTFQEWFQHLHDELDENQAGHLQNQIDAHTVELSHKQNDDRWVDFTFRNGYWVEVSGQYVYDLSGTYPDDEYDITDVLPTANTTEAMLKEWSKCMIYGYSTTNRVIAHKSAPTIDIIMGLCLRPKN